MTEQETIEMLYKVFDQKMEAMEKSIELSEKSLEFAATNGEEAAAILKRINQLMKPELKVV